MVETAASGSRRIAVTVPPEPDGDIEAGELHDSPEHPGHRLDRITLAQPSRIGLAACFSYLYFAAHGHEAEKIYMGLYPDNSLNNLDEHDSPYAEVDHAI